MEVIFRQLDINECNKIKEIDASQYIGRAWRDINGSKQLVEINYQDPDFLDKFYICAGSSEETIAFYYAIGCEETKEINQKLYQLDIRDYQLEFDFAKL